MSQVLVLFGSETGNAQDVAERIAREAKRRYYAPRVMPLDAYDMSKLPHEAFIVFVTATTGQGDLPSNMKKFWRFLLRKSLPTNSLLGVKYAVFGLGDSGYQQYNVVAKKLDRRLASLGATPVMERGLGDDQHAQGYEAALDPWLAQLWTVLRKQIPLPNGLLEPAPDDTSTELEAKLRVTLLPCEPSSHAFRGLTPLEEILAARRAFIDLEAGTASSSAQLPLGSEGPSGYGPSNPYLARIVKNERVTAAGHFQDVRQIELSLGASGLSYNPGDLLGVLPLQSDEAVEQLLSLLGIEKGQWIRVEAVNAEDSNGSTPAVEVKAAALVQGMVDVASASPRRYFFEVLKAFAKDTMEAERLSYFATPEGREDLYRYNQQEGRSTLEVLQDFPSAAPPLEWVLQTAPRLKPRQFSIASSVKAHPGQAHLLVAVVEYRTPHGRRKLGLCSSGLAGLQAGKDVVPVWIETGSMHLPAKPVPLILVGPGTGVAPFRAFLEERHGLLAEGVEEGFVPSTLIFGCRNEKADYYYRSQWEEYVKDGILSRESGLITAFSRDQAQKLYVTHRIREHANKLWALIQEGAIIYVSGSAKNMPQDVAAAFEDVAAACGGLTKADAQKYVRNLELSGRYFVESWS